MHHAADNHSASPIHEAATRISPSIRHACCWTQFTIAMPVHKPEECIFRSSTAAYFRCVIKHTAMDAIHTDPQRYIETVSAMGSAVRSTRTSMWLADLQSSPQRAIKSAPVQVADAEREDSLESPYMHRFPQMWWYEACILFHSSNRQNYKNSLNPQEN